MLFPLIGVGAQVSLQFGFVESLKKIMKSTFANPDGSLHWKYFFLSGLLCGIPSALLAVFFMLYRLLLTMLASK
jgi:hypothetical protein